MANGTAKENRCINRIIVPCLSGVDVFEPHQFIEKPIVATKTLPSIKVIKEWGKFEELFHNAHVKKRIGSCGEVDGERGPAYSLSCEAFSQPHAMKRGVPAIMAANCQRGVSPSLQLQHSGWLGGSKREGIQRNHLADGIMQPRGATEYRGEIGD